MKKFIFGVIVAVVLLGCCSSGHRQARMTSSGFNQQTYIWESFLFPTNRTSGVQ